VGTLFIDKKERKTSAHRLQGLALILSAICLLIGQFGNGSAFFRVISLIGSVLFLLGIPVVYAVQSMGSIELIGIILIELAAVITLGFQSRILSRTELGNTLILASAIAMMIGNALIGWITTQNNVFPAWVGWTFLADGLLNFIGGVFDVGSIAYGLAFVVLLLGVVARFGYGFFLYQRQE